MTINVSITPDALVLAALQALAQEDLEELGGHEVEVRRVRQHDADLPRQRVGLAGLAQVRFLLSSGGSGDTGGVGGGSQQGLQ